MSDQERGDDCRDHGHQAHIDGDRVVWTPHPPANEAERAYAEAQLWRITPGAAERARKADVPGDGPGERGNAHESDSQQEADGGDGSSG